MENNKISENVLSSSIQITSYSFSDIDTIMMEKHGKKWIDYRKKWKHTGVQYALEDTPLYIVLELNSFCNLRCIMCKHADDSVKNEHKSMPMEIFEKVMFECRELHVPSINIGSGAECTLHPQFKKLAIAVKESEAIDKFFLTNGSTLSDEMIDIIFEGEYERVEISVDAATSDTYSRIRRRGDFQRLENNILKLLSEKEKRATKLPIIRLSFCVQEANINEIDMFYEKWRQKVDIIEFQKLVSDVDCVKKVSNRTCKNPFNRLTVDYEGNIYPCCSILYQNAYCLGNIKDMTLYEAWHGEKIELLRNSFKNGKLFSHCNKCLASIYG